MQLIQHTAGEMITITLHTTAMGQPITGTLSGRLKYALVDGLLWWALDRKLDAFRNSAANLPIRATLDMATALHEADALVLYVHTAPWHAGSEEAAAHIVRTIHHYLPQLAPLAKAGPDHEREHRELIALAALLKERIAHVGEADHGLEGIITTEAQAA